jgi:hypothetical protein
VETMHFNVGDRVRVRQDVSNGNPRTPPYIRGRCGLVVRSYGVIENPQDHRDAYPPLHTVLFNVSGEGRIGCVAEVAVDIHEDWLESATG